MGARFALVFLLTTWTAGAGPQPAAFTVQRNAVVVPAAVNGAGPYSFLLDLGAPCPILDSGVAALVGAEKLPLAAVRAEGPSGNTITAEAARIERFTVAGALARDPTFLVMDLAPFTGLLGEEVAGVFSGRELGTEVTLGVAQGAFSLRRASEALLLDERTPNTVALLAGAEDLLTVSAVLNGIHVRPLAIDTTFGGTVGLPEPMLMQLGLLAPHTPRLTLEAASGAEVSGSTQIRLERVGVAGVEVIDPVCAVAEPGEPPRLGLGFLRHFAATANFERGLLRLKPVAKPPLRDPPITGVGLTPARLQEGRWLMWVARGSPAARAGRASGDALLSIAETNIEGLAYPDVARLLATEEGRPLAVTVRQPDGIRTATLSAERLL